MDNEDHNSSKTTARGIPTWLPWSGAVCLLVAAALVLFGTNWISLGLNLKAAVPFDVRASDVNGTLRIRWNAHADDVSHAQVAVLEVLDGEERYQYPVSSAVLATGALDYIRKSDDVTAVLILYKNGQEIGRRIVRSISPIRNT
jgi:hypothetical protein